MARINDAFLNLRSRYLFAEIKRRTQVYREAQPGARLIDLGIGDVTLPLPDAVVRALEEAAREQARAETLRGYGPYVGYEFLRALIAEHDFGARGVGLSADEIFVSDGGKSDAANIQELFARDAVVALMTPRTRCTRTPTRWRGDPVRPTRAVDTPASCTCRAPPTTPSSRPCPTGTSI